MRNTEIVKRDRRPIHVEGVGAAASKDEADGFAITQEGVGFCSQGVASA